MSTFKQIILHRIFIPALFMVALAGLIYGGRLVLVDLAVRALVLPVLQSKVPGLTLQVGAARSDLVSTLSLRNVFLSYQKAAQPKITMQVPELRFYYELQNLGNVVKFITTSRLEMSQVQARLAMDAADSSNQSPGPIELTALPFPLPQTEVEFDQLAFLFHSGGMTLSAGRIATGPFTPASAREAHIHISSEQIDYRAKQWHKTVSKVSGEFIYGSGSLRIPALKVDDLFEIIHTKLTNTPRGLELQSDIRTGGGGIHLEAHMGEVIECRFSSDELDLAQIAIPKDIFPGAQTGRLHAHGWFSLPRTSPEKLNGQVDLAFEKGRVFDFPFDRLLLAAGVKQEQLQIDNFTLEKERDQLSIEKAQFPTTLLSGNNLPASAVASNGRFSLSIDNLQKYLHLLPTFLAEQLGNLAFQQIHGAGTYSAGHVTFEKAAIIAQGAELQSPNLKANLLPWLQNNDWQAIFLQGSSRLRLENSRFISKAWPNFPDLQGRLGADLHWDGPLASPDVKFSVTALAVQYMSYQADEITAEGHYNNRNLSLNSLSLANGKDRLQGSAEIKLQAPYPLEANLKVQLTDLAGYLPERLRNDYPIMGDISGSMTLQGRPESLSGDFDLHSASLNVYDYSFEKFMLQGNLQGDILTIECFSSSLPEHDLLFDTGGQVEKDTNWRNVDINLEHLNVTRGNMQARLKEPAKVRYNEGRLSFLTPFVAQTKGAETGLSGSFSPEDISLSLDGMISDGKAFLGMIGETSFTFQEASFQARLSRSLASPRWTAAGKVLDITAGNAPALSADFDLAYQDSRLTVGRMNLRDAQQPQLSLTGQLPLEIAHGQMNLPPGDLRLNGTFNLPESPVIKWITSDIFSDIGTLTGTLALAGSWQHPEGEIKLSAENILPRHPMKWLPQERFNLDLHINGQPDKLHLLNAHFQSGALNLDMKGSAENKNLLSSFIGEQNSQPWRTAHIDLSGNMKLADIGWLAGRFEALRRTLGSISGQFAVSGEMGNPRFSANFDMEKGELRLSTDLPALRNIALQSTLDNNVLQVKKMSATLGGAPLFCEGTVSLPIHDQPLAFDLRLSGQNILFYRAEGLKFRGDADLNITGSKDEPNVSGTINLTDSKILKNIDFLSSLLSGLSAAEVPALQIPSFTEPPLKDVRFDLGLEALQPIIVSSNLFKSEIIPSLQLNGTGELPYLTGYISIEEGSLLLPAGKVRLDSGLVHFSDRAPDRPELEMSGTTIMKGYDITITISGPYDSPTIMLASTPPLANEDLLMLLLTGRIPTGADNPAAIQGYSNVAVYLGKNLLTSLWNNGDLENDTNLLDRLQLEIGRNITQKGEETIEAQLMLTEGIMEGNNAVLLTGEKDIWDRYNGGLRLLFKFK